MEALFFRNLMIEFAKVITSLIAAAIVPKVFSSIGKTFTPAGNNKRSLPWSQWLLACFIGGALGRALGGALNAAMGISYGFGNWAIYGAAIGIMQMFALRAYLPISGWWAISSALGWATAPLFAFTPLGGIFVGLVIGTLQIIGLKATGQGWWIGGNALAWGVVGILMHFLVEQTGSAFGLVLGWLIGGGTIAAIGAAVLLLPLARLEPKTE